MISAARQDSSKAMVADEPAATMYSKKVRKEPNESEALADFQSPEYGIYLQQRRPALGKGKKPSGKKRSAKGKLKSGAKTPTGRQPATGYESVLINPPINERTSIYIPSQSFIMGSPEKAEVIRKVRGLLENRSKSKIQRN
jgi:hypothetical protein